MVSRFRKSYEKLLRFEALCLRYYFIQTCAVKTISALINSQQYFDLIFDPILNDDFGEETNDENEEGKAKRELTEMLQSILR